MPDINKRIPSIYSIEGEGIPKGWGWTQLAELCDITGLSPTVLFTRYGKLTGGKKDGMLAVFNQGLGYNKYPATDFPYMERILTQLYTEPGEPNWAIEQWTLQTFVPAGWSTAVLEEISGVGRFRRVNAALRRINRAAGDIAIEIRHAGYSHSLYFTPRTKEAGEAAVIARHVMSAWPGKLIQLSYTSSEGEEIVFVDPRKYDAVSVPASADPLDSYNELTDAGWRQLGSPKPFSDSPTIFIRVNVK